MGFAAKSAQSFQSELSAATHRSEKIDEHPSFPKESRLGTGK